MVTLVRGIASLVQSEGVLKKDTVVDLITAKLATLLLELSVFKGGSVEDSVENKRKEVILPAICLASGAIGEGRRISPADMASACFLSESYFRKLFLGVMGESPKNYLTRLQVQKAAALLVTTKLSVAEIARKTCFEDNSTFYRRFVSFYKRSPQAYRQCNGEQNVFWQE